MLASQMPKAQVTVTLHLPAIHVCKTPKHSEQIWRQKSLRNSQGLEEPKRVKISEDTKIWRSTMIALVTDLKRREKKSSRH